MAFISISITKNHPLILGKGGFGRQLADWLSAEGWGEAEFLDDSAPGCVGGLRDYADPKLLKPGRPAFVALATTPCAWSCCKSWQRPGMTRRCLSVIWRPSAPVLCWSPGCVILPQAYVGADAHLGVGCIINGGAIRGPRRGPGPRRACCPRRHRKGRCRGGSPNQGGFWGNH